MKQVLLLLIIVSGISCSKEGDSNLLVGKWTLVETNAGTGYGFLTTNYLPGTELTINFKSNGDLVLSGSNPGTAHSSLWDFTKYEILTNQQVRFFNPSTSEEMFAGYKKEKNLSLWYKWARCGYEEKFIRH